MPSSGVGPDVLVWTKTEVQKQIGIFVREYYETNILRRKKRWKLVSHFKEVMQLHGYSGKVVLEMYKKEILKIKKVIYKEEDSFYKSNMAVAYQTRLVALALKQEEINDYMRRGISFTYVYNQLTDKKLKKINKNHSKGFDNARRKPNMDVSIEEEAEQGVVNAEELAEGKVESTKKISNNPNKITSWASPKAKGGYNLDKELSKQMKQLYMGEPKKFFQMIARIITSDVNVLPDRWKGWKKIADQEMKLYAKEIGS